MDAQLAAADARHANSSRADAPRRRGLRQIADGDEVSVRSPYGQIALPVALTADIVPGTIAVPHGWGHKGTGGWQLANSAGGANVNQLMSSDPNDVEALAGMSWLTGVPVEVSRLDAQLKLPRNGIPAGGYSDFLCWNSVSRVLRARRWRRSPSVRRCDPSPCRLPSRRSRCARMPAARGWSPAVRG